MVEFTLEIYLSVAIFVSLAKHLIQITMCELWTNPDAALTEIRLRDVSVAILIHDAEDCDEVILTRVLLIQNSRHDGDELCELDRSIPCKET